MKAGATIASALVAIGLGAIAAIALAGHTEFIVDPASLHGGMTLYSAVFAACSVISGGLALTCARLRAPIPRWLIVVAAVALGVAAVYVFALSWLFAAVQTDGLERVTLLSWAWVIVGLSLPLLTPLLLLADLRRIRALGDAPEATVRVSLTLLWAIAFSIVVLPWLYY